MSHKDVWGVCGGGNESRGPGAFEVTAKGFFGSDGATFMVFLLAWGCPALIVWYALRERKRRRAARQQREADEAAAMQGQGDGPLKRWGAMDLYAAAGLNSDAFSESSCGDDARPTPNLAAAIRSVQAFKRVADVKGRVLYAFARNKQEPDCDWNGLSKGWCSGHVRCRLRFISSPLRPLRGNRRPR